MWKTKDPTLFDIFLPRKARIMTINIYIRKENQEEINKMKVKYQLSLTTIIDILVFETLSLIKKTKDNEFENYLRNEYINQKGIKTSIKQPKIFKMLQISTNEKSKLCTNILDLFITKDFKKYIKDNKELNRFYSKVDKKLTDTFEENWNFNTFIRMQRRMLRQNKEYFKKALETV